MWILTSSFMMKKIWEPRRATNLNLSEVLLMDSVVFRPMASFSLMSFDVIFAASSPSMRSLSSVMSPSAAARRARISSSSSIILILNWFSCCTSCFFCLARSGRSLDTASASN